MTFEQVQTLTNVNRSDNADGIACWFISNIFNGASFFVQNVYLLGARDPYKVLNTILITEFNGEAWKALPSDTSRPFDKPTSGPIAVKVIKHLGQEAMKVFRVYAYDNLKYDSHEV